MGWDPDSDGRAAAILYADIGGVLVMEGGEVFRRATRVPVDSAQDALTAAGVGADDVSLVVPDQANLPIIESASTKLDIPMERVAVNIERVGNTSSGSIPMALDDVALHGRVRQGDPVMLGRFGTGMSWAGALLRWDGA